jgi:hypothetical protein
VLLAGCLVSPLDDELAAVELRLDLPPAPRQAFETFNPWDQQGLFHLEKFGKLVRVAVEAQDYELRTGTWPDPARGIGDGEASDGTVGVRLLVPAGAGRRLRGLGYLVAPDPKLAVDQVLVYREETPLDLELVAGRVSEATLALRPHPMGTVEITARCEHGTIDPYQPFQVALVDARALVIHPSRTLAKDASEALKATLEVATGRPHWVRVTLRSGDKLKLMDVRKPTFSLAAAGDKAVVDLPLPCDL